VYLLPLSPHQLLKYLFIDEAIKNIQTPLLGQSGSYVLEGQMGNTSPPWFDFNVSIVSPSPPLELISNSSFESNGIFSLNGWTSILRPLIDSVRDVPPGGGTWSLAIHGENGVQLAGFVEVTVPVPIGTHIYKFSVWTKHDDTIGVGGVVSLYLPGVGPERAVNVFHASDTAWTLQSVIDTLTTTPSDFFEVWLTGSYMSPINDRTLFDLVKLEVIE